MNTLYVTTPDARLSLQQENVIVQQGEQTLLRLPLLNIEGIVTFGWAGASPALMGACAQRNIALTFLSSSGQFLGRVIGESRGNVVLRKEQYRISDSEERSLSYAKNFIAGKIYNARWLLERATRDYPMRLDTERLKDVSGQLKSLIESVQSCGDLNALRALEGNAASAYFGEFDSLILQNKDKFKFVRRGRRPPLDPINAMLSFAYTLLAHECEAALETVGLDAYVGFLHRDRPGRCSLALDLMEELRGVMADRFVLTLVNRKEINPNDFKTTESRAVHLKDEPRKRFVSAWQERKKEMITHPFLDERLEWGLVPYVQAMLLARAIRGDLDAYPPFLWK
jgi:CRISPR-associated protein Cas1